MKKIAVLNDLSGMGKCSLTAAIPVISVMGVQACPLPTAILSAQTGFPSYYCDDYTDRMDKFMDEWQKMDFHPDGIYTGFLADAAQADKAVDFIQRFKKKETKVLVDPVMGDDGEEYPIYTEELCEKMRMLVREAAVITPNITEAVLLLYGREKMHTEWQKISEFSGEKLLEYLAFLKGRCDDPKSEKSQAFQEFMILLERARKIIAAMYQQDEEENGGKKIWKPENISASDLEKVICSGIPINKMGNLKKMSASILAKHFSQKRFSRQRINNILNHKFPVERFDLITLEFFVISQEMADDDPYTRYRHFLDEIQEILARCGMGEIYIVNPYECFILMCLLTDCPLAVFSEIWEKSYEEGEEKN